MNNSAVRLGILIIIVAVGVFLFLSKPEVAVSNKLLTSVEEKVLLPESQTPRVVVLTSIDQVRQQPFFSKAEIGDAVVVYTETVVLYRPSIDKIVSMGTIDPVVSAQLFAENPAPTNPIGDSMLAGQPDVYSAPGGPSAQSAGTQTTTTEISKSPESPQAPVSLEIRNGTPTKGLAKLYADMFLNNSTVSTVTTGNASNTDYSATVIYNQTGKSIPDIEIVFGNNVIISQLPETETPSDQDVIVILGNDRV